MRNRDKGNIGPFTRSETDELRRNCVAFMRQFDEPVPFERAHVALVDAYEEQTGDECGPVGFIAFGAALGALIRRGKLARLVDQDGVERYYYRRRRGARSFFAGARR